MTDKTLHEKCRAAFIQGCLQAGANGMTINYLLEEKGWAPLRSQAQVVYALPEEAK